MNKIPALLIILFLFFVPLITYKGLYDYTLIKFVSGQFLALFVLLTFLVQKKRLQFPFLLTIFICLWFLFNIFSFVFCPYKYAGVKELNKIFTYLTIFFLAFNLSFSFPPPPSSPTRGEESIDKILLFWFASGIFLCLWAIMDFCRFQIINAGFGNKNFFAGYIILLIPISLSLLISQFKKNILEKFILISFLALAILSLFLTRSLAAYLASFFSLLLIIILRPTAKNYLLRVLIILLLLLPISLSYGNRLVDKITGNVRFLIWQGTIKMVKEKPLGGFGVGNFAVNYPKYRVKEYFLQPAVAPITDHSHNEYLEIAAETGILGLTLYLSILFILLFRTIRVIIRKKDNFERALLLGLLSGIFAVLIDNLFSTNLRNPSTALFFWFSLGLVAQKTDRKISLNQKFSTFFLIFFLICLAVGCFQTIRRDFISNLYLKKAVVRRGQENFPAAVLNYKKAIKSDPHNLAAYYKLAFAYGALEKYDLALSAYKKLCLLSPHYAKVDKNIGVLYYTRRNLNASLYYFNEAEKINPYDIDILCSIASIYLMKDELQKARYCLKRVLILDAENPYALRYLKETGK